MQEKETGPVPDGYKLSDLIEERALATALDVKVDAIRNIRYGGDVPHIKIGKRLFYVESELMAYLVKNASNHVPRTRKNTPSDTTKGG